MSRSVPPQKPGRSKQTYRTPPEFLRAVKRRFGIVEFAIDLAADAENAVAPLFYSEAENALVRSWVEYEKTPNAAPMASQERGEDSRDQSAEPRESDRRAQQPDKDLYQVQGGISTDVGVLRAEKADRTGPVSADVDLSTVSTGTRSAVSGGPSTSRRPDGPSPSVGGEGAPQDQREGASGEAETVDRVQPKATEHQGGASVSVDSGRLGSVSRVMAAPVCVLPDQRPADAGSLHSAESPIVAGHGPLEHGPGVRSLQRSKGRQDAGELGGSLETAEYSGAVSHSQAIRDWSYLNPPFADLAPWVEKAWNESRIGARILMLVPAGVGANWWRDWVHQKAFVLLLNGRITFVGETAPYVKDCCLLVYGPDVAPCYESWSWSKK